MKILLIGEYSRLHNSLKEGLEKLGHEVIIIGFGDHFKRFPADIHFHLKYQTGLSRFIKRVVYKTLKIDLVSRDIEKQFDAVKKQLIDFDVVQLINENAFNTVPRTEKKLLDYIFKHHSNVFLLSCGTDYTSVNFALNKGFEYSIFTPYNEGKVSKKSYYYALKFTSETYKDLHDFIYNNIQGVIASDLDYHIPLKGDPNYLGMVPNPINTDILEYSPLKITDKIVIFHGINSSKYFIKGNDLFTEALKQIQLKYADKVDIITVTDLPYKEYIKAFDKAHIVLDQIYAYDQGFNALEAMAKGKVVFTGAEQAWLDYYQIEENTIAINAIPHVEKIVENLEWLIENPYQIEVISKNARAFIEKEHNYILMAERYLSIWNQHSKS